MDWWWVMVAIYTGILILVVVGFSLLGTFGVGPRSAKAQGMG